MKRDKEIRSSSFVAPADEQVPAPPLPAPVERKATATEDAEVSPQIVNFALKIFAKWINTDA